jgi:hypothetical protein
MLVMTQIAREMRGGRSGGGVGATVRAKKKSGDLCSRRKRSWRSYYGSMMRMIR